MKTLLHRKFRECGALEKASQWAFSLVELMVVIGVIALLAGLLLSGVSFARQMVTASKCSSNLKQIALASITYAADHSNAFPNGKEPGGNSNPTANVMRSQLGEYLPRNEGKDVWFCPGQPRVITFYYFPHNASLGLNLSSLRNADKIILWRDRGYDAAAGGDNTLAPREPGPHTLGYNACFSDGHVEKIKGKTNLMELLNNYP